MTRPCNSIRTALVTASMLLLAACNQGRPDSTAAATEQAQVARVSVLTVQARNVVVYDELPGRVSAFRTAEIRPQVSGIIQKRLFDEGTDVKADQPLFQIDPAPFSADVDAASAALARAEAILVNSQIKFDRTTALRTSRTASEAALGDATAALVQAKAGVVEAKAVLARRKLELSYATIKSPISGRIGQALMSEGGLASSASATSLALVQQIERVYVDVRQSSTSRELLEDLISAQQSEDAEKLPVKIITPTGKPYHDGKVVFFDISVDAGTGSFTIRVEVPNPDRQLLPGMYVRARVPRSAHPQALMVPQEAVLRDPAGRPQLVVVGKDAVARRRIVQVGALVDREYMITDGLSAGETVVVSGQDRAREDVKLEMVPYQAPSLNKV